MTGKSRNISVWIAIALATGLLTGCGKSQPAVAPVSGKVLYKNKPVANATVMFYGQNAPLPAAGETNAAGEFVLSSYRKNDGAIVGSHVICVTKISAPEIPVVTDLNSPEYAKAQAAGAIASRPASNSLPQKYSDVRSTPLKQTVQPDTENKFELILVD